MHIPRLILLACAFATTASALDWPQWRGPDRNDLSQEKGLLKEWPPAGPKQVWIYKNAGVGYAGPAVVGGRLFTLGTRDGKEVLLALDAEKGTEQWVHPLSGILDNKWGDGPRSTPSVEAGKVYTLSGPGTLACVNAADGKEIWNTSMSEVGGKVPTWGYTESPLVDGDQVVVTPGGEKGAIAAYDKATGKLRWQSKEFTDGAQYSSIVSATINGEKQYVQLTMQSIVGISAKDGALLWRHGFPGRVAVIPTPIVRDNQVYVTAGYKIGCIAIRIEPGNKVTPIYQNKVMQNHHGGVILVGDYLYGHSDGEGWVCQDWKTGELKWAEKNKLGKGAIGFADGMFYCVDESGGNVALIEASPNGWSEKGRFKLDPQTTIRKPDGRIWTHPVIVNGKLYLRDQDLIYCYAVK